MTNPVVISWIALGISLAGLVLGIFNAQRDRARIVTSCRYLPPASDPKGRLSFNVKIVNSGRRPVIISTLVCHFGTEIREIRLAGGEIGKSVLLGENASWDRTMKWEDKDFLFGGPEQATQVSDMHFVDTVGRPYRIKGLKNVLAQYWAERNAIRGKFIAMMTGDS